MAKYKPIRVGCPQYGQIVGGRYPIGPDGKYMLLESGAFDVYLVQCDQFGGKCAQTLCALHKHNRRGPATWFPDKVMAMHEPKNVQHSQLNDIRVPREDLGDTDMLC